MGRRKSNDHSKSFKSIKDIQDKGYNISSNLLTETNSRNFKAILKHYRFLDFENVLLFLSDFPEVLEFLVEFHEVIRECFPTEELIVFYYEDHVHEIYDLWISITIDENENKNLMKFKILEGKFNSLTDENIKSHVSLTSTPP